MHGLCKHSNSISVALAKANSRSTSASSAAKPLNNSTTAAK
ncbi:hypothetical protein [Pseudomonas sp. SDI]|nr:hypothetical protein [Pseudomonas sp. SDI]